MTEFDNYVDVDDMVRVFSAIFYNGYNVTVKRVKHCKDKGVSEDLFTVRITHENISGPIRSFYGRSWGKRVTTKGTLEDCTGEELELLLELICNKPTPKNRENNNDDDN